MRTCLSPHASLWECAAASTARGADGAQRPYPVLRRCSSCSRRRTSKQRRSKRAELGGAARGDCWLGGVVLACPWTPTDAVCMFVACSPLRLFGPTCCCRSLTFVQRKSTGAITSTTSPPPRQIAGRPGPSSITRPHCASLCPLSRRSKLARVVASAATDAPCCSSVAHSLRQRPLQHWCYCRQTTCACLCTSHCGAGALSQAARRWSTQAACRRPRFGCVARGHSPC